MALEAGLILFVVFAILLILGMPIAISVAASSICTLLLVVPFDIAVFTSAQKMVSSLNSFSLVAIPFFVLSGIIMNGGGIAEKLVNFAMLFVGRVPGGLAHTNILGNALFGSMSSSAIAASTAIGGVLIPQQVKAGYDRKFATAANIASAPTSHQYCHCKSTRLFSKSPVHHTTVVRYPKRESKKSPYCPVPHAASSSLSNHKQLVDQVRS